MSVRKRKWTTRAGEKKEAWVVDYVDQQNERHIQTFERKKDADEYHATVKVDVRQGIHTPQGKSLTVEEAAKACPKGELGLVFPNTKGKLWDHADIVSRYVWPTMVKAGVTVTVKDADGKPATKAKYTGLHALRHFYASWLINRKKDGGLELPMKIVQARLGHSSIVLTADIYGHLFDRGDDGSEMAEAERLLLA
jgi:hypothetical protein